VAISDAHEVVIEARRQGFILGFGGTRVEEMPKSVRHLRRLVESESGYRRRQRSVY
jgi:hypothetical protein